jgi:predicted Zn finger-like uncharacterized protein
LITECPNCETTFRVTSAILRAARGQVRCGRCQTQFDAVERLVDEDSLAASELEDDEADEEASVDEGEADILVEEPEEREEITLEGKRIEITGTYRIPAFVEQGAESQEGSEVIEEHSVIEATDDDVEEFELDDLEESPSIAEPNVYDLSESGELRESSAEETAYTPAVTTDRAVAQQQRREKFSALKRRIARETTPPSELDLLATREAPSTRTKIWMRATAPLALLLVLQVIHHYRNELAVSPRVGGAVTRAYAALHLSLTPQWQLNAYEVRQWGVIMDPSVPGTLKVRASVRNTAAFPQPYPLLKLVLENRWGEEVRARAFQPSEYLEGSQKTVGDSARIKANDLVNAVISIADPGADAEGFRFDVCLPRGTDMVCADNRG